LDAVTNVWNQIEVLGHVPLLLVEAPAPREDPEITALYLSVPTDLSALETQADVKVRSVKLLSPRYMNQSESWKLEDLLELWRCTEAEAWVFVVESATYAFSPRGTAATDLVRTRCAYRKRKEQQR
jgi:hypothetical protein